MATFTKKLLSGSTNGQPIKITVTTNGTAQTIHTAVLGVASLDEVWLYAYNDSATAIGLTLLWGGTTEPDNKNFMFIPSKAGRLLIVDGQLLQNGLLVKAYADTANVIILDGYVNNIS